MSFYLIKCSNKHFRQFNKLNDTIASLGPCAYEQDLDFWIVKSGFNSFEIHEKILNEFYQGENNIRKDHIFVINVESSDYWYYLESDSPIRDFLNSYLPLPS